LNASNKLVNGQYGLASRLLRNSLQKMLFRPQIMNITQTYLKYLAIRPQYYLNKINLYENSDKTIDKNGFVNKIIEFIGSVKEKEQLIEEATMKVSTFQRKVTKVTKHKARQKRRKLRKKSKSKREKANY